MEEVAKRAMKMAKKLVNSNTFINIFLVGSFIGLAARSMYQQNLIEALESEKQSLVNTNKSLKKSIWDSKQQLYAEASSPHTAIVPLSRLKQIYGELVSLPSDADADSEKAAKSSSKLLI